MRDSAPLLLWRATRPLLGGIGLGLAVAVASSAAPSVEPAGSRSSWLSTTAWLLAPAPSRLEITLLGRLGALDRFWLQRPSPSALALPPQMLVALSCTAEGTRQASSFSLSNAMRTQQASAAPLLAPTSSRFWDVSTRLPSPTQTSYLVAPSAGTYRRFWAPSSLPPLGSKAPTPAFSGPAQALSSPSAIPILAPQALAPLQADSRPFLALPTLDVHVSAARGADSSGWALDASSERGILLSRAGLPVRASLQLGAPGSSGLLLEGLDRRAGQVSVEVAAPSGVTLRGGYTFARSLAPASTTAGPGLQQDERGFPFVGFDYKSSSNLDVRVRFNNPPLPGRTAAPGGRSPYLQPDVTTELKVSF